MIDITMKRPPSTPLTPSVISTVISSANNFAVIPTAEATTTTPAPTTTTAAETTTTAAETTTTEAPTTTTVAETTTS